MIVFILLFLVTLFLSYSFAIGGVRKMNPMYFRTNEWIIISFVVILLFVGLRYNVGRDFIGYCDSFKLLNSSYFGYGERYQLEYGYLLSINICRWIGLDVEYFFLLTTYITLILFFNIYKINPKLLPCGILVFFLLDPYVFIINGIRQGVAIFAFLNAIIYINKKYSIVYGLPRYLCYIILGLLFHTSILFVSWIYIFRFVNFNNSKYRFLFILIPVIAYMLNLSNIASRLIDFYDLQFTAKTTYNNYIIDGNEQFFIGSYGINFGQIATFILLLLPIWYSPKIFEKNSDVFYFLPIYVIGMTISMLFNGNMIICRLSYFMLFTYLFIIPIMNIRMKHSLVVYMFWTGLFIRFFYTIPDFYFKQIYPNASILGISIN